MEKEQRERKGSDEGRRGKQRGTGFSELKVTNLQNGSSFQVFRINEKKQKNKKLSPPKNTRMEKRPSKLRVGEARNSKASDLQSTTATGKH